MGERSRMHDMTGQIKEPWPSESRTFRKPSLGLVPSHNRHTMSLLVAPVTCCQLVEQQCAR